MFRHWSAAGSAAQLNFGEDVDIAFLADTIVQSPLRHGSVLMMPASRPRRWDGTAWMEYLDSHRKAGEADAAAR
jgi:hypothetical protein